MQLKKVVALTLFVEDLTAAAAFYRQAFGLAVHFADDNSTVFHLGNTLLNLLQVDRPWGVRTAAFADPAGHVWEIAQPLGRD